MPKTILGKPVDESKWNEAKKQAAEQGHAGEYDYVMSIYKKMSHLKSKPDMKLVILSKGRDRPIGYETPGGYIKTAKGWRKKTGGKGKETEIKEKIEDTKVIMKEAQKQGNTKLVEQALERLHKLQSQLKSA